MHSRKLSMRSLLDHQVDPVFSGMDEGVSRAGSVRHSIRDVLMSALAMFAFKSRSLLEFETRARRAPRSCSGRSTPTRAAA